MPVQKPVVKQAASQLLLGAAARCHLHRRRARVLQRPPHIQQGDGMQVLLPTEPVDCQLFCTSRLRRHAIQFTVHCQLHCIAHRALLWLAVVYEAVAVPTVLREKMVYHVDLEHYAGWGWCRPLLLGAAGQRSVHCPTHPQMRTAHRTPRTAHRTAAHRTPHTAHRTLHTAHLTVSMASVLLMCAHFALRS